MHSIMRRYTTSPLAMFFALPAHRTGVRLRGTAQVCLACWAPARQGALLFCWETNEKPDIDDEDV